MNLCLFWAIICGVYYIFVHPMIVSAGEWISGNPFFSFFVGMYFGVMVVDICYSLHIVTRVRKWAAENNVVVRLEQLKLSMKVRSDKVKKKIGFLLPFRGKNDLTADLDNYREDDIAPKTTQTK